ncbi:hypothetical protein V2J09_019488 [Rumex salicifolius]
MDPSKKRKVDENGTAVNIDFDTATPLQPLTPGDARKIVEPLATDQLVSILQDAVIRYPDILASVRAAADIDPAHRKLFIRSIGSETTTDSIRSLFSAYGELEEAIVITDKTTGKSKGYGFVTFKHVDGAVLALKQPSKRIDGRMAVAQLAAAGSGGPNNDDVATRKIYVGNIAVELSAERLLDFFSAFGEIEEGPLGFDKQGGKPKGFALFVYRTEDGAKASLMEPVKYIDGHQVLCKLAVDGKKGKGNPGAGENGVSGMGMPSSGPGLMNPQYGGPMYTGFGPGPHQGPAMGLGHQGMANSSYPSSMGGPGMGSVGNQGQGSDAGGYGSGSYKGGSQFSGPVSGEFSSQKMPPNPMGKSASTDPAYRKLFIRGIGPETTTDSIRSLFSSYGELEEAVVIADKITGKSKGYGFVTFKHVDGAIIALKQPSKKIDGRMVVAQLASAGSGGPNNEDIAARKIYVGNIPVEFSAERLLDFFSAFGEIEEGPLGFDRQAGKVKGFAFFVYRTADGAKASLIEPMKYIDGHQVMCKLAVDGKKGKGNDPSAGEIGGDRMGRMGMPSSGPGSVNHQYAGSVYGEYGPGTHQGPGMGMGHQGMTSYAGSMGSMGNQGHAGGYGHGSYMGGSQFGGPVSGDFNSQRMPANSMGMPAASGYPETGPYGYGGYQSQHNPTSQPAQGPTGGILEDD